MNRDQINKLNMFEAVEQVLTTYNAVWNSNIAVSGAVNTFTGHINTINTNDTAQKTSTVGVTENKTQLRQAMADAAMIIANAGISYAHATNNTVLFNAMNHTENEIMHATDTDADDICQNIHDGIGAYIASMSGYGADATSITALQNAINAYSAQIGKPKETETISINATETLAKEFVATMAMLENQLTTILFQYRASNAAFYNQFIAAKVIEDIGRRKTVVFNGHMYDGHGSPLPGVLVTLSGKDTNNKVINLHKTTDANGYYRFTRQHTGTYILTPVLSAYTAVAKNISATENKSIITDFTLNAVSGTQ
jgi:hypothetical protein